MTKRKFNMYHGHQSDMFDRRLYPPVLMHGHAGGGGMPGMPGMAGMGRHEGPAGPVKICGVCGDRAKSLHFGGMACDSCKAFFRRSVQNEAYKHFRCAYENCCPIDMSTRKSCQSCRFNKCVEIGMEKTWVMSEEERAQQLKIRQEKKRQKQEEEERRRQAQEHRLKPHVAQLNERHLYLSDDDVAEIDHLLKTFYNMYQSVPVPQAAQVPQQQCPNSRMVDLFISSVSRLVGYVTRLPRFRRLLQADQKILLKNGVLAMVILRGAMCYEENQHMFTIKGKPRDEAAPKVGINEMKNVCTQELYESHYKFLKTIKNLNLDEPTLMLLQMVVLYSSDRMGLSHPEHVSSIQEHYTNLVRRYMNWWYGEENAKLLYPRMLHRLADLRTLTEAHNMNTIRMSNPDVGKMVDKFRKIDLNPYPAFPEFLASPHRVKHESEPDTREGSTAEDRPMPQRSTSLPGYGSGLARFSVPQGAEAGPFPAHAQYGVTGYPGEFYSTSPQACPYREHSHWNPGFAEMPPPSIWHQGQNAASGGSSSVADDFDALLGIDSPPLVPGLQTSPGPSTPLGHEEKRLKTDPSAAATAPPTMLPSPQPMMTSEQPMLTSQQSMMPSPHLMMTSSGYAHAQTAAAQPRSALSSPGQFTQTSASGPQSPFSPMFATQQQPQGFGDPSGGGFTSAPGGYLGNYPRLQ